MSYERIYIESGERDTLIENQLIGQDIPERDNYGDREDMGGTALTERYIALPAVVFNIDSITKKYISIADTFAWEDYPTNNYGGNTDLLTYQHYVDGNLQMAFTYMKFATILNLGTVTSAKMYLRLSPSAFHQGGYHIVSLAENWDEYTLNWNNKPKDGSGFKSIVVPESAWYEVDVTDWVQYWAEGSWPQYGIRMFDGYVDEWVWCQSRESDHVPYLIVTYKP